MNGEAPGRYRRMTSSDVTVRETTGGATLCTRATVQGRMLTWFRGSDGPDFDAWIEARSTEDAIRQHGVDALRVELVPNAGEVRCVFLTPSTLCSRTVGKLSRSSVEFDDAGSGVPVP